MNIELTAEQSIALGELYDFYKSPFKSRELGIDYPFITLGGYAGTGKTCLITFLSEKLKRENKRIAYCAFTGKASVVLKNKLEERDVLTKEDYIGTIHKLIYTPIFDNSGECPVIIGWQKVASGTLKYDAIIVDEASMINEEIFCDLCECADEIPIFFVGDHGQLPPVNSDFSLMKDPILKLSNVHRQALDNPIIKLSEHVRKGRPVPFGKMRDNVFKVSWKNEKFRTFFDKISWSEDSVCLCGFNKTRVSVNKKIRRTLGMDGLIPQPGERLICLRNNHSTGLMNGQIATVYICSQPRKGVYDAYMMVDNEKYMHKNYISTDCFMEPFPEFNVGKLKINKTRCMEVMDFGYCISVHKSQGSEWKNVILFDEAKHVWDQDTYNRWLYTGITRAKEKLIIVTDFYGDLEE